MTYDLIKYNLTAEYVWARVLPSLSELAYGFHHGWLKESEVVEIAQYELAAGVPLTPVAGELALLLKHDKYRVAEVLSNVGGEDGEAWQLWLYLALAWLRETEQFEDPYEIIEMLYADFGYPEQLAGLVRFMPAPDAEPRGLDTIDLRWTAFLYEQGEKYGQRDWTP